MEKRASSPTNFLSIQLTYDDDEDDGNDNDVNVNNDDHDDGNNDVNVIANHKFLSWLFFFYVLLVHLFF